MENLTIVYVGTLGAGETSTYRFHSLRRLGHQVSAFDVRRFSSPRHIVNALKIRFPFGPIIWSINRNLLGHIEAIRPDVVWFDKPIFFTPETLKRIAQKGPFTICYNQDNPFGERRDPGWSQFKRVYRQFNLHCLFRDADVARFTSWGLPFIRSMFSYDNQMHHLPPRGWTDEMRDRELSFIGSPYEERCDFLHRLSTVHKLPLSVSGPRWEDESLMAGTFATGPLWDAEYREGIWRSKINLAFISRRNQDDMAHKSVEICACGGFLLARRSEEHRRLFVEDREAVFFSDAEECAMKARYYLENPGERASIAEQGHRRCLESGYDNDTQLKRILDAVKLG